MDAVIYCRVSTDEEIQINALQIQIKEAKDHTIDLGWNIVDEYIDEGKSGTTTKRRNEYNRLFDDLESNKFDIIVVKSQDRLMRNTMEWYLFIDRLVKNNKRLYFYLDNKFYTPDDALLTGIKAILAEEYSRDLSKKLNNAHKSRQKKGERVVLTSRTWGYDVVNKKVSINENEAEMIRLIYDMCIKGYGSRTISKSLSDMGYKSRTNNDIPEITIRKIIKNPLYYGTAIMNKKHYDFDTKKTIMNDKEDWIYCENVVPPIINKETWEKANLVVASHTKVVKSDKFGERMRGVKLNQFSLSGKIICGECGSVYWRRYDSRNKNKNISWSCSEYLKRGRKTPSIHDKSNLKKVIVDGRGCDAPHIKEKDLNDLLFKIAYNIFEDENSVIVNNSIDVIKNAIKQNNSVLKKDTLLKNIEANKVKRGMLTDKFLEGVIDEMIYKNKDNELKIEYEKLNSNLREIEINESLNNEKIKRLENIKNSIKSFINKELTVDSITECIDKIIVNKDTLEIHFYILDTVFVRMERVNYRKVNYVIL